MAEDLTIYVGKSELMPKRNTQEGAIALANLCGDLAQLTVYERTQWYFAYCRGLGLNPLSYPIDYIPNEQGKLRPYVNAVGMAQIRQLHKISTKIINQRREDDLYIVIARAIAIDGRYEDSTAALPMPANAIPKERAKIMMKCETKAKRRATLALVGLPLDDGEGRSDRTLAIVDNLSVDEIELDF
jgi:hypothetical protein